MDDSGPDPGVPRRPRPRTGGDSARLPVQIALGLLALFIGLLALWFVWPLLTGG